MACGLALTDDAARLARERTDPSLPVVPSSAARVDLDQRVDPRVDHDVDLVVCPECQASNTAQRARCARCGAPLWSEPALTPAWHDEGVDAWHDAGPGAPGVVRRRRGVGVAVAVVVLGLVLGTGLGLAAGMGVGPFATVEPVPFDRAAYPRDARPLRVATATSSSTASPVGARTFGPDHTVDGDLATAWVAGEETGDALLVHGFVEPVWVDRIEVATGDQYDQASFADRARVLEATVDLGPLHVDAVLAGIDGVQVIQLEEPVLTDEITWEVTETTGGSAAVSEVRYAGWQADEADRSRFRQR